MQREILTWAFGFFTIPVMAAVFVGAGAILGGWFGALPEHYRWLNSDHAWAGGWLFIGAAIVAGVILYRIT